MTVFLTTHNLSEAEKLCHRVGIIRDGKLLAHGSPHDLRARYSRPRLEIVGRGFSAQALAALKEHPAVASLEHENSHIALDLRSGTADNAALVSLAVHQGVQIEEVHQGRASLEEAFLALMQEEEPAQ
jgi:ABC-2 type transport system ATP-binding protein